MDTIRVKRNLSGDLYIDTDCQLPSSFAVTMGLLDGVHRGHTYLLSELRRRAREKNLPTMAITFHRPPQTIINSHVVYERLCDLKEKSDLLEKNGIDYLCILHFDKQMAQLSSVQFMTDVMVRLLNVKLFVVGYDHRFGKYVPGENDTIYQSVAESLGMSFIRTDVAIAPDGFPYSSTRIRTYLREGDLGKANALLGYSYKMNGIVVSGDKIGRQFGYPTANLQFGDQYKLLPADGVYAARVYLPSGEQKKGMLYIGKRPTIGRGLARVVEVNIFDFNGDLYGQSLEVSLESRLRGDMVFTNTQELVLQLARDKVATELFFKEYHNGKENK